MLAAPTVGWTQATPDGQQTTRPATTAPGGWLGDAPDAARATMATGGLNPVPVGGPLYNWGRGIPSTARGGVTDPLGFYVENGGVFIWKARSWGTEDRACGLSVIMNENPNSGYSDNDHCGVTGTIAQNPSRIALYAGLDSVSLFAANNSLAPLITDPAGSFDATHYYPSSGHVPTRTQLDQERIGEWLQADNMKAQVTAITPKILTVSGWFAPGNQSPGQVPARGSTTYVMAMTAVWSANFAVGWDSSNPLLGGVTGIEQDVYNDSRVDSSIGAPTGWGFDAECGGTKTCGIGHLAGGAEPWVVAFYAKNVTFAGYVFSPPDGGHGATGFWSNQTTGNLLEESYPATGTNTVVIAPDGNASFAGQLAARNIAVTAGFRSYGLGGEALEAGPKRGVTNAIISPYGDAYFSGQVSVGTLLSQGVLEGSTLIATGSLLLKGPSVSFPHLPTADPRRAGELWNDRGTVHVSGG
jgi:hypothetical protein